MSEKKQDTLHQAVIEALKQVYDPELPVDIYALGLIYKVDVDEKKQTVHILMTLTTPNCPVADSLPEEVRQQIKICTKAKEVTVELTFDPPYDISRLSEEAKLSLGLL